MASSTNFRDEIESEDNFIFMKPKTLTCRIISCKNYYACTEGRLEKQRKDVIFRNFGLDWRLPGHGKPYKDCGNWRYRGCLNKEGHSQNELFSHVKDQIYVEWYHRNCGRAECPICYERWAGLQASKIEHRLKYFWKYGKCIHVSVSPPKEDIEKLSYQQLRKRCYDRAKSRGIKGGSAIWHPFRENDDGTWRISPHFHLLCFGWINFKRVAQLEKKDGWVVHYINDGKIERSISATALYQLSHCGISEKQGSPISYFGVCGFAAAKKDNIDVKPMEKQEHLCPCCKNKLIELEYLGNIDNLPDKDDSGGTWLSDVGWYQVESKQRKWTYG